MFGTFILLGSLTALFATVGYLLGGAAGATVALGIAAAMNLFAWWRSDAMVLSMHNAQPVTDLEAPELYRMTADLAARANIPMPKLYIIHEDQPNAFATGRSPERGAVAVNTGLLDLMKQEEVAGVIAHELAHIKHRDTLLMAVTATLAGAIGFLAQFGMMLGRGRDNRPNPLAMILVMLFAPLAAMVVQMAISRTREFEADAEGARICGNPNWLANGLAKLERGKLGHVNDAAEAHPATAHMFIINPLSGLRLDRLFATHPPTEERIARLMAMGGLARSPNPPPTQPWSNPPKRNPWA